MFKKIICFFKRDVVLSAAFILAIVSCFIVPPDSAYTLDRVFDFNTLIMLFCLMLIVEGMREQNLFQYIGGHILKRVHTGRSVVITLVFLCFFGVCLSPMMCL